MFQLAFVRFTASQIGGKQVFAQGSSVSVEHSRVAVFWSLAFAEYYCAFRCSYVFIHFLHPSCLSSFILTRAVLCVHELRAQHSETLQKLQQLLAEMNPWGRGLQPDGCT